jgi:hypothetical protein
MRQFAFVLLMGGALFATACKKEETTKAPLPRAKPTKKSAMATANVEPAKSDKDPLVTEVKDVPLDEMPRVTINVDLSNCMGTGRWIDPKTPASPRVGAVSVSLSTLIAGDTQPDPWVYEPIVNTGTDGAVLAKGQHAWRLSKTAVYTIDVIAYNVQSSAVESKLSSKIDFKSTNDVALKITGSWKPTLICELQWQ